MNQCGEQTIALLREGERLWVRHAAGDAAVLRLSEPLPVPVAALPFSALADGARISAAGLHLCSSVFVLTHPTGFPAHEGGFAVARQGVIASHPLLPAQRYPSYAASFTTFNGEFVFTHGMSAPTPTKSRIPGVLAPPAAVAAGDSQCNDPRWSNP